jgi:hypothetical protein
MIRPNLSRVVTYPPGGGLGLSLSHLGHVAAPVYSWVNPGGCDQLSTTLYKPARVRSEALNPGRIVKVHRGGSVVWNGILDEPTPSDQGWAITAHGSGTMGNDYVAIWTGSWGTGVFDNAVDAAIARGLNWKRPATLAASGIWTGQQFDSGSQTITDLLNLGCTKGALTWQVTSGPGDRNVVSIFPLPTAANRVIIATSPEAQSIASGPNSVYLRYQSSADSTTTSTPAVYGLANAQSAAQIAAQGLREDYTDLSSAGTLSGSAAAAVGTSVLQRFQRAGFTDPFTIQYGQLTNLGGAPVDPGVYYQDSATVMVCRALLSDFAFAGEVNRGPVIFPVGSYQWDDGAMTATITPFGSVRHDFTSLMSAAVDSIPVRHQPTAKKKKGR